MTLKKIAPILAFLLCFSSTGNAANDWMDVTDIFIQNPGFDNNSEAGWTVSNAASHNLNFECNEFWQGTFDIYQQLSGLPKGKYRLSVQAYYRYGSNDESYSLYSNGGEDITAVLYADESQQTLISPYTYEFPEWVNGCWTYQSGGWWGGGETHYFPNTMESAQAAFQNGAYWNELVVEAEGSLTIGLRNSFWHADNWCIFDNFKLEFQGNAVKVSSVSISAEHTQLMVGETMQCSAVVLPDNALQKGVTWTSTNSSVATVDGQGVVTALNAGTTTIRATSTENALHYGEITLTIDRNTADGTSLVINEIMSANVDQFISPAFNFDGWAEFYNPTDKAATLGGLYLSDEAANLKKWRMPDQIGSIPAKGYKVVWFDSNALCATNAPFKLDVDGATLYVSDSDGKLIVSQSYPAGKERVSYARTTDGGSSWGQTSTATPGATNNTSSYADVQLAAPVVDQPSRLFDGRLSVNVTIPAGTTLRYTTDGTLPTPDNGQVSTTGQFSVTNTAYYRFRLFAANQLASPVTTRSYIYNDRDYYLPVVSVVSDPDFLYDNKIGVYVRGNNGRPGNGQEQPCNWNMDWERPVNLSYLDADGTMVLNQDVDLEMCGGWSRAWTPHSFKLKGNKEMGGNKHLPYPFFAQKPYIRNRTLQIRNGGNDTQCRFKDAALAYIVQTSGIDIDVQAYQPAHEFINGQYIGVLNVREPNNKHYVYANYGWDDDEIDQFEMSPDSGYVQKCGTSEAWDELVDVLSPSAANNETYQEICQRLDVDEFAYYMAVQFYYGGSDWPRNNVKAFRHRDNGKFRFILFDVDAAFDYGTDVFDQFMWKEIWTFDQLYPRSLGRITAQIKMVTLFRNLLQNATFRRKFIDTFSLVAGSVFEITRCRQICDQLFEAVEPAMNLNGGSARSTYSNIRNILSNRLSTAANALKNFSTFNLSSVSAQRVRLQSDAPGAQLYVNGLEVPTGYFNGMLYAPVTLRAAAPAGYAFQGWVSGSATTSTVLLSMGSSWQYYDKGALDNQNWTAPTYSAGNWSTGKAPLGYGNPNVAAATTLDYGTNANSKRPTYYFRTSVTLSDTPTDKDEFTMNYVVDDGIIVYVNGSEAARFNMPSGTVSYNSYASTYANANPERGSLTLPASLFRKGSNVIAVELHNNSGNSTDIIWDCELLANLASSGDKTYYSTQQEIALPSGNSINLTASYRPLTEQERQQQGIHPVCINEISGSNNSLINEYAKKNDWVELYNTTDEEIDVEGMYLSDNLDKPEKYQITKGQTKASTKIPAHGYLIIWCDKLQTSDQALHASFKIDGDGGLLTLTAADKSWTDVVFYEAHDANTTVGRYPDGGTDIYAMNVQTIEKANLLSSYTQQIDQEQEHTSVHSLIASANGFRLRYGNGVLLARSEAEGSVDIEVYTADGRTVERQTVALQGGTARISVDHLPAGLYIARATNADGTRVACKFIRS
jgi:hypothetical protein